MFKSSSIDPVVEHELRTEDFADGSYIIRNLTGEIVRTCDALGIKREFGREALTQKLMVRKLGIWTKLEGCCLDSSGTLFYRRGDTEIQERLNGVHIHTNRQTGVMIQTDHINRAEIMKQAHGEVWKRQTDDRKEQFEIWLHGKLTFRTQTFFSPIRCEARTPAGTQPLVYVVRHEQSWNNGVPERDKFTFRNPQNQEKEVTLSVPAPGTIMMFKSIASCTTNYMRGVPIETVYEFARPTRLRVDLGGARHELADVLKVHHLIKDDKRMFAFVTTSGAPRFFPAE